MNRTLTGFGLSALVLVVLVAAKPVGAAEPEHGLRRFDSALTTDELAVGASQQWTVCTPLRIAVFRTRIHVRCATAAPGGIFYFAAPVNDPARAARFLSILTAAYVMGRDLDVLYDPDDLSGSAIGCGTGDCRLMTAVEAR